VVKDVLVVAAAIVAAGIVGNMIGVNRLLA